MKNGRFHCSSNARLSGKISSGALVVAVILTCFLSTAYSQDFNGLPFVRNYSSVDYRAGIQNFSIGQAANGLLYFGNNYGLLEYDGEGWRLYGVPGGTKVRSVAVDLHGRVYVGSQGEFGYFEPKADGRLAYTSLAAQLPEAERDFDEVWSVYTEGDQIFFCTFSRIFEFRDGKVSAINPGMELDQSFLINGRLLVNRRQAGLSRLENRVLVPMADGGFFGSQRISSMLALPQDQFVVSTFQNGIYRVAGNQVTAWNEALQAFFKEAGINVMIQLSDGRFAAGTQNEGLLLLSESGEVLMKLNRGQGLENRTILSLFEDREKNLWAGQNNIISRIQIASPFSLIQEPAGIRGTGYAAWSKGKSLYLGTNTGLYVNDTISRSFHLIPGTDGQVYQLNESDGKLLLSHHRGAALVENESATFISSTEGSWTFLRLSEHQALEGTYTGLQLYEKKDGNWQLQGPVEGFRESARVMALSPDGTIWVTHGYKGAFRLKLSQDHRRVEKVDFYGDQKGFPTNRLINVFAVRNNLLFTSEFGVFTFDDSQDRFVPDPLFSRLLGPQVQLWMIREDHAGNLFFVGRDHIGMLKKNALGDYEVLQQPFLRIRKFLNDDLLNLSIIGSQQVAFTAKEGFIFYDGRKGGATQAPFDVLVREVRTQDSLLESTEAPAKLRYASNSIRFAFAATSYLGDAGDVTYQYLLEGFDREWSGWSSVAYKEYTNLREKDYTFRVRARNMYGDISGEKVFRFSILPPWYRTTAAYLLYTVFGLSLIFTAYKILSRKHRSERRLMAIRQRRELNRSHSKLKELSQESESRISTLENEKLASEVSHMKTELATATMHLLNKNEVMASIRDQLSELATSTKPEQVRHELNHISKRIEDNLSRDEDWEQFRFRFDRVHGDFIRRMMEACPSLTPQEIKLCAYLRLNLSTKEIANLMNISVRGVEISRYRLRKKLNLQRTVNLQEHILHF